MTNRQYPSTGTGLKIKNTINFLKHLISTSRSLRIPSVLSAAANPNSVLCPASPTKHPNELCPISTKGTSRWPMHAEIDPITGIGAKESACQSISYTFQSISILRDIVGGYKQTPRPSPKYISSFRTGSIFVPRTTPLLVHFPS